MVSSECRLPTLAGDADGLGAAREVELYESYEVIGVPRGHVKAVNHRRVSVGNASKTVMAHGLTSRSELQDGMTIEWSTDVLVKELEAHLARRPADVVRGGNHCVLHVRQC